MECERSYVKDCSTKTTLHGLVTLIEKLLHNKEFCLVVFLDIEWAFNNIPMSLTRAVIAALASLGIDTPSVDFISQLQLSCIITENLKGYPDM